MIINNHNNSDIHHMMAFFVFCFFFSCMLYIDTLNIFMYLNVRWLFHASLMAFINWFLRIYPLMHVCLFLCVDFYQVAPSYDVSEITALSAAHIGADILCGWSARKKLLDSKK